MAPDILRNEEKGRHCCWILLENDSDSLCKIRDEPDLLPRLGVPNPTLVQCTLFSCRLMNVHPGCISCTSLYEEDDALNVHYLTRRSISRPCVLKASYQGETVLGYRVKLLRPLLAVPLDLKTNPNPGRPTGFLAWDHRRQLSMSSEASYPDKKVSVMMVMVTVV